MFKRLISILTLFVLLAANTSYSQDRKLGVDPLPPTLDVTATTWVNAPGWLLTGRAVNTSFMGGGLSMYLCFAFVTVKDVAQTQLKTRVLFNGATGTLVQTTDNADGSQSRVYQIVNPPGVATSATCKTQLQVAKTSANIALKAVPAPPEDDQLSLSVLTN